ncbi:MAG: PilZ domain-containing protein [Nitrospiraceae bacterium]
MDARRDYERLLVGYPASFSSTVLTTRGQIQDAKGTIVNLSIRGCQMRTEVPLQPEAILRLTFTPTDHAGASPIVIEQAIVRSSSGKTNGIEFIRLGAEDDKRIRQIIHDRLHNWMRPAG